MRAVNLIRDERPAVGTGGRSQGTAAMVLALIGALAILAGLYGVAAHQASSRHEEAASLQAETQVAQQRVAQLSSYTSFAELRNERVQDVSELIQTRFDWASALRELGRVLPQGAAISSLGGSIAGGAPAVSTEPTTTTGPTGAQGGTTPGLASATPAGSTPTFAITGCAGNQAQVARTLYQLRLIAGVADVQLESSARSTGTGLNTQCGGNAASFTATVTFDPLPSTPAPVASSTVGARTPVSSGSPSVALSHSEAAVVERAKAAVASSPGGSP